MFGLIHAYMYARMRSRMKNREQSREKYGSLFKLFYETYILYVLFLKM